MTEFTHDQSPITMEFTYEEHELLTSILNHAQESYDFVATSWDFHNLPEDSEILKRFEMLQSLRNRSWELWDERYSK